MNTTHIRPLCIECKTRPAAYNYTRKNKIHYRKKCDQCIRRSSGKITSIMHSWQKAGYRKRAICEKCGFKAKHPAQLDVYHVDGDLSNANWGNLKTICANCSRVKSREEVGWAQGDLKPD